MVRSVPRRTEPSAAASGICGEHVVAALQSVAARRASPRLIRVDNGPEFVSKVPHRRDCPSSEDLRRWRLIRIGVSGSLSLKVLRPAAGAASGGVGWSDA